MVTPLIATRQAAPLREISKLGANIALPIFHLHIPKTGGQTFARRLASGVAPHCAWYMRGDITAENPAQLSEFATSMAVVSAHASPGSLIDEGRFRFIALARNPVDQIVSNYLHVLRDPANPFHDIFSNLSVEQSVDLCRGVFANFQSRSLVCAFVKAEPGETHLHEDRFLSRHLFAACERLSWLAPMEQMDELCMLLSLQSGADFTRAIDKVNAAPELRDERADQLRNILLARPELYAIDLLLYQEAKRRHAAFKAAMLQQRFDQNDHPPQSPWRSGMVFL